MKTRALPLRALVGLLAAALAAPPAPAAAQDDVRRVVYGFYGSSLDVEVATEAAGRIQLIRGRRSRIEVAGWAPQGFTSTALGGDYYVRRLTLTSLGVGPVDFIVAVPEDVRVRIVWEGSNRSEQFGTLSHSATFAWDSPAERPAFESVRPDREPSLATPGARRTPRVLDVVDAHRADRLSVHVGAAAFAIGPASAVDEHGDANAMRVTPRSGSAITIDVPAGERMTLRLDGIDAIVIEEAGVRVLCESVLSQTLPGGQQRLTLTPVPLEGCRGAGQQTPRTTPTQRT